MKVFLYLLAVLMLTSLEVLIHYFLFKPKNKLDTIVEITKSFVLINVINLAMFNSFYGYKNLFNPARLDYLFFLYYFLNGLLIIAIYLGFKYLLNRIFIIEKRSLNHKGSTITLLVLTAIFFFIGCLGFSGTAWEREVYYNSSPDQIFITMLTPLNGTDSKLIFSFIEGPLMLSLALTIIYLLISYMLIANSFTRREEIKHINEVFMRNVTVILASILFILGLSFTVWGMQLDKIFISYTIEDSFVSDNYVNPSDVKIKINGNKRNLIHIYLESIENSFFDKENGGIMDENLMPNLLKLYEEGDNFSNKDNYYGGPLKTYGGSFSVASMVNQFFGIPMKVPTRIGQYAKKDLFLPGAIGIGDILNELGYNQTMLLGGDSDFSGLTNMYRDHGNFKIMDYKYAKENALIADDYRVNWGYEDEKLYEFAKEEILRLSQLNEPFHVLVENADTHNPGFAFDSDGKPIFGDSDIKEDYAKTIKFSEKAVYEFVKWIMKQDFYPNTTVVIIGDHNSMDGSLFKGGRDKNYTRTTYNLILNAKATKKDGCFKNRKWANFDYMPTILSAMGFKIEGDRLGVGTNLYSGLKTVYEKYGYDEINRALVRKSDFYNETFMNRKHNYDGSNLIVD